MIILYGNIKSNKGAENMFCGKCGTKLEDGSKFCGKCGTPQVAAPSHVSDKASVVKPPEPFSHNGEAAWTSPIIAESITQQDLVQMFLRYDGRLNRKPYIMRGLALGITSFLISLVIGGIGAMLDSAGIAMLAPLISFVLIIPMFMLMIRRLHDLNRPTWWIVGAFIPLVNVAFSLYLLFAEGTYGANQFGPDPLER